MLKLENKNNVHILSLPAHSTHGMAPLDRTCFAPLKVAWADCQRIEFFLNGRTRREDVVRLYETARKKAMTPTKPSPDTPPQAFDHSLASQQFPRRCSPKRLSAIGRNALLRWSRTGRRKKTGRRAWKLKQGRVERVQRKEAKEKEEEERRKMREQQKVARLAKKLEEERAKKARKELALKREAEKEAVEANKPPKRSRKSTSTISESHTADSNNTPSDSPSTSVL